MAHSFDSPWIRRTKWLTQALIISGTLNIGLLATFVTFVLKEKQEALTIEHKPLPKETRQTATNEQLLRAYSLLPFQELILRLENKELVEEGLTKRDLALACLCGFHHFNIERALGGLILQKRQIPMRNTDGQETIELIVFPGLADYQFQAIVHYARTEKWPLTSQGLFYELKRALQPCDPSLLEAFYLTSEFRAVQTLFVKTGLNVARGTLIDLLCEGEWSSLAALTSAPLELTPDGRRSFLLAFLDHRSAGSAKLLLQSDLEFVLKRFNDSEILTILDILHEKTPELEVFTKELLASPRTDAVWKKAAAHLYALSNEPLPEPYDHDQAMARFLSQSLPAAILVQAKEAIKEAVPQKKIHTVEAGESLWKIARKYHVSVEEIMRVNHLETEKLRLGKQLEIPEKKSS